MLSNTLILNFCYLKIIHVLHQRYHPKVTGHILKNKQMNKFVFMRLYDNHNENEDENKKIDHTDPTQIDLNLDIVNIKSVSIWCCLFVLSNTSAIYEPQFMKKLSDNVARLKKRCLCVY